MLNERIKKLREENNLSQKKLAETLGVTQQAVAKWEGGKAEPDSITLINLSKLFCCSTDYLLGHSTIRNIDNFNPSLNNKDKKEIDNYINDLENQLMANEGLMFDGKPLSDKSKQMILNALRVGTEMAKKEAKRKYTPKKYRVVGGLNSGHQEENPTTDSKI